MTRGAALVALWLLAMLTNLTHQERQLEREIVGDILAKERFVDIGVTLHVVVQDPDGEELLEGKPKVRIVRTTHHGGIVDTKADRPYLCDASRDPVVWYASEEQAAIVMHGDDGAIGQLVIGSEGAGKSVALVQWHYFRVLEHLGERREGGQTAPTNERLDVIRSEMFAHYRPTWFHHHVAADIIEFCDGTSIRLKSTYQQSRASGSPIQGWNWSWCGRDEGQDQVDRHEDIEARGRAAKKGGAYYKQLITATAKDDYAWKNLRGRLLKAVSRKTKQKLWDKRTLLIRKSPFVSEEYIELKRAGMTEREFDRRIEGKDLPSERILYHTWRRADEHERPLNLAPIPRNARDVTAQELRGVAPNLSLLVGYDPGKLYDASILLKAYLAPGWARPRWWVVGEVTTDQQTTEAHIQKLLELVGGQRFGCNLRDRSGAITGPQILVRADPYGDTGNDENQPDITVYRTFRNHGILIKAAAYVATADSKKLKVQRVPREARIDLICTLLCAANKERRLYVEPDEHGQPCAPKLVEAFETMERDEFGQAETQRKDRQDLSHWPCAAGYGLWAIEKPRIEALRKAA